MKNKYVKIIFNLLLIYVAWTYVAHGFQALFLSDKYLFMMEYVGISAPLGIWLIKIVGILDIFLAIALFCCRRGFVYLWAFLWPIVPLTVEPLAGGEFGSGKIIVMIFVAVLYFLHKKVK